MDKFILLTLLLVEAHCISLEKSDMPIINRLAEYSDCDDPTADTTVEQTGIECTCQIYTSKEVPNSVHKLMASDISVVAAIGDGMTAGNAAGSDSITDTLTEYRGLSFSAGGQGNVETIATLPNILKKFNTNLKGFSSSKTIGLNVAETGATTNELSCQAAELVDMMKADTSIDYEKDWKMVTILIGSNDLCNYCLNKEESSPTNLVSSMTEALDLLLDEMPRAFINVVLTVNAYDLSAMADQGPVCTTVYMKACPCVAAGGNLVEQVHTTAKEYQELLENLVGSGRYEKQDFAVVVQPFLQEQTADKAVDMSLMAADCINLSKKGQAVFGIALWNSLFIGTNNKKTDLRSAASLGDTYSLEGKTLTCPNQNQYLATSTNTASGSISVNAVKIDAADDTSSSSSSSSAIVAVSVIGGCVCLVAIIFGAVAYRRVRQRKGYNQPEGHPLVASNGYTKFS